MPVHVCGRIRADFVRTGIFLKANEMFGARVLHDFGQPDLPPLPATQPAAWSSSTSGLGSWVDITEKLSAQFMGPIAQTDAGPTIKRFGRRWRPLNSGSINLDSVLTRLFKPGQSRSTTTTSADYTGNYEATSLMNNRLKGDPED